MALWSPSGDERAHTAAPARRVVVAVGTDVHPFDRLVRWADLWSLEHPDDEVMVQYGESAPPRWATGRPMLGRAELLAAFATANVAVVSCGPGAVMDARSVGRLPVVVPRRRDLGEHVDDHQSAFAGHLARHHLAVRVTDEASFRVVLGSADASPLRVDPDGSGRGLDGSGRAKVGSLVDQLVWSA